VAVRRSDLDAAGQRKRQRGVEAARDLRPPPAMGSRLVNDALQQASRFFASAPGWQQRKPSVQGSEPRAAS